MQIEPLNIFHQPLLENRLRQLNLFLSEYSFANLYLFRQIHHYEVIQLNGEVFIKGQTRDKVPFIMLTSHPMHIPPQLIQQVSSLSQILFPIPENWLSFFDKWLLQASFKEEDTDYLYTTSKFATYAGRHFDGKRNQVKQFLDQNEVRSEKLDLQLKDAQSILNEWQAERSQENDQTDYSSCYEAIQLLDPLHLSGLIVYVNQTPSGVLIGEWINKECYVIHFSKASRSIKGLYQYLFQELARSLENTSSWINLEQDLGIAALRHSKLSYQPDLLVKKWRLQLQFNSHRKSL